MDSAHFKMVGLCKNILFCKFVQRNVTKIDASPWPIRFAQYRYIQYDGFIRETFFVDMNPCHLTKRTFYTY